jgi:hypothetical protein
MARKPNRRDVFERLLGLPVVIERFPPGTIVMARKPFMVTDGGVIPVPIPAYDSPPPRGIVVGPARPWMFPDLHTRTVLWDLGHGRCSSQTFGTSLLVPIGFADRKPLPECERQGLRRASPGPGYVENSVWARRGLPPTPRHARGAVAGWAREMKRLLKHLASESNRGRQAILEARAVKLDHLMSIYGTLR